MSHFYASIKGNRSEATRCGTKNSGIDGHIRGWHIGAEVNCFVDGGDDDICHVYVTTGSAGDSWRSKHVFTASRDEDNNVTITVSLPDNVYKTFTLEV